jgi:hypothetical protein
MSVIIELDKRYRVRKVAEAEAMFLGGTWDPVETHPGEWHLQLRAGDRARQILKALRAAYPLLTFRVVDCDLPAAVQT